MSAQVQRIGAIFSKELVQMRRDRLTFGMMLMLPVMQLILFGFAINMDPKRLPTAVHVEEATPIVRMLVAALETSGYYDIKLKTDDPRDSESLLASGEVAFVVSILRPENIECACNTLGHTLNIFR